MRELFNVFHTKRICAFCACSTFTYFKFSIRLLLRSFFFFAVNTNETYWWQNTFRSFTLDNRTGKPNLLKINSTRWTRQIFRWPHFCWLNSHSPWIKRKLYIRQAKDAKEIFSITYMQIFANRCTLYSIHSEHHHTL